MQRRCRGVARRTWRRRPRPLVCIWTTLCGGRSGRGGGGGGVGNW